VRTPAHLDASERAVCRLVEIGMFTLVLWILEKILECEMCYGVRDVRRGSAECLCHEGEGEGSREGCAHCGVDVERRLWDTPA
jgi:hypothetical protein